ncbi:ABC transporter ATP-binding protein [Herbaspirillum sp. RTI4]|uniref:ABC transporter ATP-binding protein n=1 Tax=Herbaspirillum sp. RTI4 TaxID=3048640 RepID=UPI002AB3B2A2|nr:ABC transporter ATP-binding protein [Herbaspirillum sp. RTI4]MDY7579326.1 ABC transporter ATP-binding protein [Herbaspirillum sp. RTI4]MEA9980240.1 ABC transporter ATP-binding protein [Herbaspirillum sp. RTI4]
MAQAPLQHNGIDIPAIQMRDVHFRWPQQRDSSLEIAHFNLPRGGSVFISGPSGSGKSTLLALIGGIVKAQTGEVKVLGTPLSDLSAAARDQFRVDHIGFIFQQFNLLPYLSILDNVMLPCRFSRYRHERACTEGKSLKTAAETLLRALDLAPELWSQRASRLSIGQQQRVAAARALIGSPEILIADEPTSALDAERQQGFLDLVQREARQSGASLIFVSHDQRLAQHFDSRVELERLNHAAHGMVAA